MKKKVIILLSIMAIGSITLNSCRKKGCTDEEASNYEEKAKKDNGTCEYTTESSDDHNEAQKEFDDIQSILDDAMAHFDDDMDKSGGQMMLSDTSCATITIDTAYSTGGAKGRLIIDFGTTNCTGSDGRNRRGKIYIAYTGKYRSVGTVITTTFDNFFVNDNQIEGTRTVETESREVYNVKVRNAKITFTDNTTITWETDVTRTWTEGNTLTLADIFNIWNDVYDVTGTASGTGRLGIDFNVEITSVTVKLECWLSGIFHPVSGSITVSPSGFADRVVDFGNGACDKKGTITIGSNDPIEYDLAN